MSDAAVAQVLGSTVSLVAVVGGWIAWAHDWTLFLPFAAALLLLGIVLQGFAWSWRRAH
jgi:hypothetical protein